MTPFPPRPVRWAPPDLSARLSARPAPRHLALILAATLSACGGAPTSAPPSVAGPVAPPSATAPAFPPVGTFATPGLPDFGGAVPLPANEAEASLRPVWSPRAAGSPALACTAREYAVRFAADRADPGPGTVAALSEHCGLWAPPPDVFAFTAPSPSAARAQLEKAPAEQRARPCALGAVTHPDGAVTVAVATPPLGVVLDPLPRVGAPGTAAKLTGTRTTGGDGALWLYSTVGEREVTSRPLVTGADGRFEADVVFPGPGAGPGANTHDRVVHEIARVDGPFLRSLAVVTLRRDAAPTSYPAPPMPLANAGRDAQETALLGAVNVQRKTVGLPPLKPSPQGPTVLDPWLEGVARGTATAAPAGLVDERGWPFVRLRYAFAAGVTVGEAMAALGETPLGRSALLRAEDTSMAFGLRPFGGQPGHDVVVVALERFQAPEPADVRGAVLTAVNGRRKLPGLPPLTPSPVLDAVAQQLADDALAGRVAWDKLVPAAGRVLMQREVAVSAFGAGGLGQPRFDAAAVAEDQTMLRKDLRALGVGVAAGPLSGAPAGQSAPQVVIVYVAADAVPKP